MKSPIAPPPELSGLPASARIPGASLSALQAFDTAFRLGGFKAAALALHLTESAISHRIRRLETLMGARLFDRLHRRVRPTRAGEALAVLTGRAFRDLARALDEPLMASRKGVLKLSVFPLFGSTWLLPRMADFIAQHPNIELSITTTTRLTDLDAEAVDVVIRSGSGDWPGLTAIPLVRLQTTPLLSPPLAEGLGSIDITTLMRAPIIQMSEFPSAWPTWFASHGLGFAKPDRTVWVNGFEAAMLAAERGAGVALGLWPLCAPSIATGKLIEVPNVRTDASTCWLAFRSEDIDHPHLATFRRWLESACAETVPALA